MAQNFLCQSRQSCHELVTFLMFPGPSVLAGAGSAGHDSRGRPGIVPATLGERYWCPYTLQWAASIPTRSSLEAKAVHV